MLVKISTRTPYAANAVVSVIAVAVLLASSCTSPAIPTTTTPAGSSTPTQATATNIPTASQTPKPTLTSVATPTENFIDSIALEFDLPGVCLFDKSYLVSRDQDWIGADCNLYQELWIKQKNQDQITIAYQELSDLDPTYFTIQPLSWSPDNRFFYFTTLTKCCLGFLPYNDAGSYGPLYQIDTTNGSWSKLIRDVYKPLYYFSNDGTKYVSLNHFPANTTTYPEYVEIRMTDISANKNKRFVFKNVWGPINGNTPLFAWSQNNAEFAIVVEKLAAITGDTTWLSDALLKIDFTHWKAEIIDEYDESDLLREQ
jgi:hypothetical protein